MKRLLCVAAICLIAAPALAGPDILPVTGTRYATYKAATGELFPTAGPVRYGNQLWAADVDSGYYTGFCGRHHWAALDWGDIPNPINERTVNGFQFGYATDLSLPNRINVIMTFYVDDNGWNSGKTYVAGFLFTGLPTMFGTYNAWWVTVDLEGTGYEFLIDGPDLDPGVFPGVDFAYAYWFDPNTVPFGSATGPQIDGAPNYPDGPGQEDVYDGYGTWDCDVTTYQGSWWFGGPPNPFAQFRMILWNDQNNGGVHSCPNPGATGNYCWADIDGDPPSEDCIVGLADLTKLLTNYGTTTGMTHYDGDIEDGNGGQGEDGDVDLADLSMLLTQYGDNCN